MTYENKDDYLKKCYSLQCPSPVLFLFLKEIATCHATDYALAAVLENILNFAVPNDIQEIWLREKRINIEQYIKENLQYAIAALHFTFKDKYSEEPVILKELGNAFYTLTKDAEENAFKPPQPKETFDIVKHDYALDAFRRLLIHFLETINALDHIARDIRRNASLIIVCFARTLFEMRGFQAPLRLTAEAAIRDSLGETNLWQEYLEKWQLLRYLS